MGSQALAMMQHQQRALASSITCSAGAPTSSSSSRRPNGFGGTTSVSASSSGSKGLRMSCTGPKLASSFCKRVSRLENGGFLTYSPLGLGGNIRHLENLQQQTRRSKSLLRVRAATTDPEGLVPTPGERDTIPLPDVQIEPPSKEEVTTTLQLGSLFGLWYLFNIYFNIYNKQVLKVYSFPVTVTAFQFAVGTVIVLVMWLTGLYKKPKVSRNQLVAILPLAVVHTLGNLFTNMSLGKVAVSFTHTIKAMEPFFSVTLSALFLGEHPNPLVVASLAPIVGGVALASLTEVSFNWPGFLSAMASNLTFQSRNVLSKKLMLKKEGSLDNINLFSIITIMSFFLLAPVALLADGVKFTPSYLEAAGLDVKVVAFRALVAAVAFHSYQQVSYMILQRVNPVTHSVGNCVKRVVVIVTSVFFFRTPVSPINALGTAIALAGVFAYSRVKATAKKEPKTA